MAMPNESQQCSPCSTLRQTTTPQLFRLAWRRHAGPLELSQYISERVRVPKNSTYRMRPLTLEKGNHHHVVHVFCLNVEFNADLNVTCHVTFYVTFHVEFTTFILMKKKPSIVVYCRYDVFQWNGRNLIDAFNANLR